MPTYNYKCEVHGEFEASHSIKEELEECPQCKVEGKSVKPQRLISMGTGFILIGGGWAKEGYS
jgi:putative FmdB family regulatory protein